MGLAYNSVMRDKDELLSRACNDVVSTNSVTMLIYISLALYRHGCFYDLEKFDYVRVVYSTNNIYLSPNIFLFVVIYQFTFIISFYGY
jgi:hypothetical protein